MHGGGKFEECMRRRLPACIISHVLMSAGTAELTDIFMALHTRTTIVKCRHPVLKTTYINNSFHDQTNKAIHSIYYCRASVSLRTPRHVSCRLPKNIRHPTVQKPLLLERQKAARARSPQPLLLLLVMGPNIGIQSCCPDAWPAHSQQALVGSFATSTHRLQMLNKFTKPTIATQRMSR